VTQAPRASVVRVLFLGGVGEIGRNMLVLEADGRTLAIDCGLSFPSEEMLGVDLVLPDFRHVTARAEACEGVILTHGHEDHIGALSWFLREAPVPVYGTPLTLGLARRRLVEFEVEADLRPINAPGQLTLGPFVCSFIAVSHSIPDAISVVVDTSAGRILYTSDFKLDETPVDGRRSDVEAFARVGAEGVDLMLSDSTNAERGGRTPSEAIVGATLRDIFGRAPRRIVVACFASNLHRIQQVCEAAEARGRKVAFVGRSMVGNVEVGRELGHLKVGGDTIVHIESIEELPPEQTVIVCTGSQGEPLSALSLIAAGEHKWIHIEPGDVVILSASPIPGNEPAVHRVINSLYRSGATVHHSESSTVHVSGHAAADELRHLAALVAPRHFVPVHGEYRQLALHAEIARSAGIARSAITLVEDGDVLELERGRVSRGVSVPAGTVLVDGLGVGDVGPVVLRDRRLLAGDGFLLCVVTIDSQSGEILAGPDLISRGFVHVDEARELLDAATDRVVDALDELEDGITEWTTIKKTCRRALGEYIWGETRRRPMIVPVVMEV
jgi:ribonuclease J